MLLQTDLTHLEEALTAEKAKQVELVEEIAVCQQQMSVLESKLSLLYTFGNAQDSKVEKLSVAYAEAIKAIEALKIQEEIRG